MVLASYVNAISLRAHCVQNRIKMRTRRRQIITTLLFESREITFGFLQISDKLNKAKQNEANVDCRPDCRHQLPGKPSAGRHRSVAADSHIRNAFFDHRLLWPISIPLIFADPALLILLMTSVPTFALTYLIWAASLMLF